MMTAHHSSSFSVLYSGKAMTLKNASISFSISRGAPMIQGPKSSATTARLVFSSSM